MLSWAAIFFLGFVTVVILVLIIRLFLMVRYLKVSIAKLGFVIREDAKKYFDEASDKIVKTNQEFQTSYTKIVHDGTISALADAGTVMEKTLQYAHQEAGSIIIKAREDAQNIIAESRNETSSYANQALGKSADTIRWVMEQYTKETFDTNQHQDLIKKLLDEYINEQRA